MSFKKKITIAIVFIVSLGLYFIGSGTAYGTNNNSSVHHPDCPAGWTQIKSQPPSEGFSVTAAYSGTMWIKVATIHFEVPVVTAGDVITPSDVSTWPTNKKGKYQEISHVDYCIPPEVPPTTEPPVTTVPPTTDPPVTTVPPTTEPPVVTTEPPVVTTTPPVVTTDPPVVTTTPPVVTTTPPVVTVPPATTTTETPVVVTPTPETPAPTATTTSLPATGGGNGIIPWIAALLLVGGLAFVFAARRNNI